MCNGKCCGSKCVPAMIGKILLIVGGINWGLVGVGMLMNQGDMTALNVVHMVLGTLGPVEAIVYILVGVAGVMKIVGCRCKKCVSGTCAPEAAGGIEKSM